jgi:hypothetical protein
VLHLTSLRKALIIISSEVVASNHRTNAADVPKQVSEAIQNSIRASIDYHDYMSDAHSNVGDSSINEYHKLMADAYHALKTK